MFASTSNPETLQKDLKTVMSKTNEDIAESLEIMMVETRPLNEARTALRGACCLLRKEPTSTTAAEALHVINALIDMWVKHRNEPRVLICQRAKKMIGEA